MVKVLTLGASKGGVGKTTLTTALAVEASKKHLVGLYDADPQSSLGRWFELRSDHKNLKLIAAKTGTEAKALADKQGCDLLICDTPPGSLMLLKPAIDAADFVLVPVRPSPVDVEAVDPTVELAEEANVPFAFVISMASTQGGTGYVAGARKYLSALGDVLNIEIHHRLPYVGAMGKGMTGPEFEKDGKCGAEITALWTEIRKRIGGLK